jgi:uncharacterized membrane protein YhaH (DUF805 family)
MLSGRELVLSLVGTLRLVRRSPDALAWFNATLPGFWRSFSVAAMVAPLYVLATIFWPDAPSAVHADPLRLFLLKAIAYVIGWVAYPLAMVTVLRLIDRDRHYFRYMVAYNWLQLPKEAAYFLVAALYAVGLMPEKAAEFLSLLVFAATLYYFWYLAKSALETDGYTAAGLVLMDLTVSLLISGVADRA